MRWIGERCTAFKKEYPTAKRKDSKGGKPAGKPSTTAATTTASTTTTTTRATKIQAAFWHDYTIEVLDQIMSAIAEAKATAKQRQRVEIARRTVRGLEELGLPVSEDLRTLAGKVEAPKPEAAPAEVAAPQTEGETKETFTGLFEDTEGETPADKAETGF
jgi:hypothetical protein